MTQSALVSAVRQASDSFSCSTIASSAASHAPYIESGSCYWAASNLIVDCSTFSHSAQRICPCLGVSPHDHSRGSAGSAVQHSSAGHSNGALGNHHSSHPSSHSGNVGGHSHSGSSTHHSGSSGSTHHSGSLQPLTHLRTCKGGGFRQGQAQRSGGSQHKFAATYSTEDACRRAALDHCTRDGNQIPVNGVTYSPALGECWCNFGMTGFVGEPSMRTCWFESSGPGRLWSIAGLELETGPAVLVVAGTFVGAALVGAVAGLIALRRLQTRPGVQALIQEYDAKKEVSASFFPSLRSSPSQGV